MGDESHLPNKERFRRLIPYMTFYLDQGYNTQSQYINPAPQDFQAVQAVHNNLRPQPYYVPQYQQQQQQQKLQLVPLGYLVGGGYRRTPVYSRPSQPQYQQGAFTPQHPSDLTRMIAQNYLSMVKEVNDQTKDQRPAQYTTKLEFANHNQNQAYKPSQSQTKAYFQPRHRFQPNHNRQPYTVKSYQPSYTSFKDDSYVQLHSNYDVNHYDTKTKLKNYEPDPNFMTITKSQEIKYPVEENLEPEPVQVSIPESTPASLPQLHSSYEQSLPTGTASLTQSDYEPSVPTIPTEEQNNLLDILSSYQLSKVLPDKVTPSNIGYSIRTLSNILKLLEKAKAETSEDIASAQGVDEDNYGNGVGQSFSPYQTEGSTPGRAGVDYPAYAEIPETQFTCKSQRYKGFFADPDTNCQVNTIQSH